MGEERHSLIGQHHCQTEPGSTKPTLTSHSSKTEKENTFPLPCLVLFIIETQLNKLQTFVKNCCCFVALLCSETGNTALPEPSNSTFFLVHSNIKHDVYKIQSGTDLLYVLNAPIKMRWAKNYSPYLALKTIWPKRDPGSSSHCWQSLQYHSLKPGLHSTRG